MRDEQDAAKLLTCGIERGQPRLTQAGRQDDQPSFVARFAGSPECCKCFQLYGVWHRRWFGRFGDHLNDTLGRDGSASFSICVDPIQVDRARLRMDKQIVERSRNVSEPPIGICTQDTVVPFHAALQRWPSQIRAADESGTLSVAVVKDVGLGVERSVASFEYAELEVFSKIHQVDQGIRVRRIEIVACDDPHATALVDQVAKVLANKVDTTLQDECHREVGAGSPIQARPYMGQQRIVGSTNKQALAGWPL